MMTSLPNTTLSVLFAPVSILKGVGPKMVPLLSRLLGSGISTPPRVLDLLFHMPVNLIDRGALKPVAETMSGQTATVEITVAKHRFPGGKVRAPYRILGHDDSAEIAMVYFAGNARQLAALFPIGEKRIVSGRIEEFNGQKQIVHPDYVVPVEKAAQLPVLEPVYPLTVGLYLKNLHKFIDEAVPKISALPEWIDPQLMIKKAWPPFHTALAQVHQPQKPDDALPEGMARTRLAYDELLAGQLALALLRQNEIRQRGQILQGDGKKVAAILAAIPYQLTQAQERVIDEIHTDMCSEMAMLRLLQGDVGSGKTIVAMLAMARAAEAGKQSVLMAPTEILARQHYASLQPIAEKADMTMALLTGREKGKVREEILEKLLAGEIDALIGTHALFQEGVNFSDLALAIVDEQHRFGVNQRLALSAKGAAVDMLVMTATPIPRTLVLTYYGDMDVSKLDEKPVGRKPIETRAVSMERMSEVIGGLQRLVKQGGRAYWICPLIEESENSDLAAVESRFEDLQKIFGQHIALLHGRMKSADKDAAMQRFASGEAQILVATTVIEVGVNVPEATAIVIEQAERFGLAQLHQLRGRVGRSDKASSCILLYAAQSSSAVARERLKVMRETEDGFIIAEADLKLRGHGDVLGTKQSGLPPTKMVEWSVHAPLAQIARDDARAFLEKDSHLLSPRGQALQTLLRLFDKMDSVALLKAG
ncbi:MAG: ATP-dependent DNA helicase RecG [Pseudomonadota bacterium]